MNKQLKRKLIFLGDNTIKSQEVGVTCERCVIQDCKVRQGLGLVLDRIGKSRKIEKIVNDLNKKFE